MKPLEIAVAQEGVSPEVEHWPRLLVPRLPWGKPDAGALQFDNLIGVQVDPDQVVLAGERVGVDPSNQVVVEGDGLHLVGDHLGRDSFQFVEGNVHRVNVEVFLSVKVVPDLFDLILMNIQPVQGP